MTIRTLTSANAIIIINSADVFPKAPAQLQGFSADNIYGVDPIETGEAVMGVDGILSAGYTPKPTMQKFSIQSDSLSVDFFEAIYEQQKLNETMYELTGTTTLPSVQKRFTMTRGFMTLYSPMPPAGKILNPRDFTITWGSVIPFNLS